MASVVRDSTMKEVAEISAAVKVSGIEVILNTSAETSIVELEEPYGKYFFALVVRTVHAL